ncbi:MAG: diacylglycerol kinase family protein [Planctomycetota bacterium]|nr:diacylglycerol kinase family protein [Planctomycetota bacterium]
MCAINLQLVISLKYAFVVNSNAGRGSTLEAWAALVQRVDELFDNYTVVLDRGSIPENADVVVAVGGDGTVNYVVNYLMSSGCGAALGVLPLGSGCDFARNFAIDDWLENLSSGRSKKIDIGEVEINGHKSWFANVADAGIGAKVTELMSNNSRNYLLTTLRALLSYKNVDVKLEADGVQIYSGGLKCLAIANGKYFGDGMGIAPDAVLDDGLLQYVIVGNISRLVAAIKLQQTYKCTHIKHPHVHYGSARELRLEADGPLGLEVDGELSGGLGLSTQCYIRALPSALAMVS